MDTVSKEVRSWNMSRIRSKDTTPELIVRRIIHAAGFRYRLHVRSLAGCPDLVFRRLHKIIFVHGCFWHRHHCANGRAVPGTRKEFWETKFEQNSARDAAVYEQLHGEGWGILVVWECETRVRDIEHLQTRLIRFLRP